MKFSGELKFPEIDHPGVPITFVIEGPQAELVVEGESLGRWSLFDVHARRLVASAFLIDLDGTEVTFVADDPIDFAYRGVEHMAGTWAKLKSKRIASRSLAVRKSRKGTMPSRIDEMRTAMEANLEAQTAPRHIAGEVAMPESPRTDVAADQPVSHWDAREQEAGIPLAGPTARDETEATQPSGPEEGDLSEAARLLDEERQRIAEERVTLEEERRLSEQREADRVEAYRLEMQRLEVEREELRRQAAELAESQAAPAEVELEPEPEPVEEPEPELEPEEELVAEEPVEELAAEEPVEELAAEEPVEEPEPELEPEEELVAEEPVEELVAEEPEEESIAATAPVVDLNDLEDRPEPAPTLDRDTPRQPEPQPAMAGVAKEKSGGLMGAVRAAFRSSSRDHEHQFIEAPGGIGITRYVCEECGYVSISV